jgi:hypothetical protein
VCIHRISQSAVSYQITDISPECGLGGKRVLKHSTGGLEACAKPQLCHGRSSIPLFGTKCGRPPEQRCDSRIRGSGLAHTRLFSSAEAAEDLRRGRDKFVYNVKNSLRGGNVNGTTYDNVSVN